MQHFVDHLQHLQGNIFQPFRTKGYSISLLFGQNSLQMVDSTLSICKFSANQDFLTCCLSLLSSTRDASHCWMPWQKHTQLILKLDEKSVLRLDQSAHRLEPSVLCFFRLEFHHPVCGLSQCDSRSCWSLKSSLFCSLSRGFCFFLRCNLQK